MNANAVVLGIGDMGSDLAHGLGDPLARFDQIAARFLATRRSEHTRDT